ncbi:unnamed protein product [Cylindrotheca closterium]|uniref:Alpha-mannosidase n=1 Tax=Cylindrotheca closterium TaxID=2856 RepID=A0AAD2CDL4_9STRA|nr:unnamed protein product [Cylindrotheca closterium]
MKYVQKDDEEKDVALSPAKQNESSSTRRSLKNGISHRNTFPAFTIKLGISVLVALGCLFEIMANKNRYAKSWKGQSNQEQRRVSPNNKSQLKTDFSPQKLSANMDDPRVLNIHVVPHTHDDVGWLKTVDQYYYGLNNTIQHVCVKDILDTAVASLLEHESRTFTYVESKFFSMWWNQQTDAVKDSVRYLVANKQLSFSNGGWSMHDEAATHFMGMIDQTTLGHEFLKRELGVIPKVGWQLDPFGHSASQASLFTHKMGFDALFFGRMDYQELRLRQLQRSCEGLWNASENLDDSTIFWGLTGSYVGNYGNPQGFCFDEVRCGDPSLLPMNKSALVSHMTDFLDLIRVQADMSQGNHIMITMGSDFHYQHASYNYANLDKLILSLNMFQGLGIIDIPEIFSPRFEQVNIFFSSPEYYTKCKHDELLKTQRDKTVNGIRKVEYGIKKDDFFPYADREHGFWTGYFTSRASLKRHERVGSSFLLAARQIETMADVDGAPCDCDEMDAAIYELEDALGVIQHHDGVSGTAKQHVANDYSKRLQKGIDAAVSVTSAKLGRLVFGLNATIDNLTLCQKLNETVCDVSQAGTHEPNSTTVSVIVYNALGQPRWTPILLPVSSAGLYSVRSGGDPNSTATIISSLPSLKSTATGAASFVLPLDTGVLPALGAKMYQVAFIGGSDSQSIDDDEPFLDSVTTEQRILASESDSRKEDVEYSNGLVTAVFDGTTGELKSITASNFTLEASHEWGYYTSWDYNIDGKYESDKQNSGAYIFRPSSPDQKLITVKPKSANFQQTAGFMEVHIEYDEPWIQSTYRILPGQPHLEVEYTVGPIPVADGVGKEVVSRFWSPIKSSGTFYTDSNGREFMERRKNYRPSWDLDVYEPVAGNYYPVNAAIYVEDESKTSGFAIAVDRSQGGASLHDGSIELMVHRRTLADDSRGVGEPINETDGGVTPYPPFGNATRYGRGLVVRGKHRIMVGGKGGATLARSMMDSSFADPLVFVGSSKGMQGLSVQASSITGIGKDLPANVMLITRRRWTDATSSKSEKQFLIRLGHQYGLGEDDELSNPAAVDLVDCLPEYEITEVVELTLSGNQKIEDWEKSRLVWTASASLSSNGTSIDLKDTAVELQPMDIRTFRVTVKS